MKARTRRNQKLSQSLSPLALSGADGITTLSRSPCLHSSLLQRSNIPCVYTHMITIVLFYTLLQFEIPADSQAGYVNPHFKLLGK